MTIPCLRMVCLFIRWEGSRTSPPGPLRGAQTCASASSKSPRFEVDQGPAYDGRPTPETRSSHLAAVLMRENLFV